MSNKKITKKSFKEATCLKKIWNKVVEWEGYTLGTVMWHFESEWKVIEMCVCHDTITDNNYKPIVEFHTQEELWQYLKADINSKNKLTNNI